jgi:hypothetical protein
MSDAVAFMTGAKLPEGVTETAEQATAAAHS